MSRHRQRPKQARSAIQGSRGRRLRSRDEPIPDLWEVPGTKMPGNPRISDHDVEHTYVVDVRGNRVEVVQSRITKFKASSAGIETIYKVRRPQLAPELWSGPRHHTLTHALRLLQINSCTFDGQNLDPGHRQLRGDIQPNQLLQLCGASDWLATTLLRILVEADLLRRHSESGKVLWFVSTRVRGFGPGLEQYTRQDLADDFVLPEFLHSVGKDPEPMTNIPKRRIRGVEEHRQDLQKALEVIRSLVPKDAAPDENGAVIIEFQGSAQKLLQEQLGLTASKAATVLTSLKIAGLTKGVSTARGISRRQVCVDRDVSLEMVQEIREFFAKKERDRKNPPNLAPQPPVTADDDVATDADQPVEPEQLVEIIEKLVNKLKVRDQRIAELEEELAVERSAHESTREQLQVAASTSQSQVKISAEALKYLEGD